MIVRTAVFRRVIRDMAVIATPVGTPVGALAHRDRDWRWSNLSIVKQRYNAVPAVLAGAGSVRQRPGQGPSLDAAATSPIC